MDDQDSNSSNHDASSLLLIEQNGTVKEVRCPFKVVYSQPDTASFIEYPVYTVSEVIGTRKDDILFVIDGNIFSHSGFVLYRGLFRFINYNFDPDWPV